MRSVKQILSVSLALVLLVGMLVPTAAAAEIVHWGGTYTAPDNNTVTTAPLPTDPQKLELVWSAKVGTSTIAIIDDNIYTMNSYSYVGDGTLYKINRHTGEIVRSKLHGWTAANSYSYMIYADGTLYVSIAERIAAFDPETLNCKWNVTRTKSDNSPIQYVNGYLVSKGLVLNASNGTTKKTLAGTYNWANGVEVGGYYYVAASDGKLRSFDTTNWNMKGMVTFDSNGSGAGVMHYNGRLYWGDQLQKKIYMIPVNENGTLTASNLVKGDTEYYTTYTTPVAMGNRIYLTGVEVTDSSVKTGYAAVCAYNALTLEKELDAMMDGDGHKIQSTPILYKRTMGGAETSDAGAVAPAGVSNLTTTTAYIYVQDYANPGKIFYLADNGSTESLQELLTPAHPQYSWEQMACDNDGALYISTDAGYLMKYQTIQAARPVLQDGGAVTRTYKTGETAQPLTVSATVTDDGTLSYQWQSHNGDGNFADIPGATAATLTPSTQTVGETFYRCVVTNTRAGTTKQAISSIARIIVEQGRLAGDVNGDSIVDGKDVTALIRYLAGWQEANFTAETANVNGDNTVDVRDLVLLCRYVAGWEVRLQ